MRSPQSLWSEGGGSEGDPKLYGVMGGRGEGKSQALLRGVQDGTPPLWMEMMMEWGTPMEGVGWG